MMIKKKYLLCIRIVIIIIFSFLIYYSIDVSVALREVKSVPLFPYVLVISGHFLIMIVKAKRWQILSKCQGANFRYTSGLRAYFIGFTFATFTPGQIGDFGKIAFISENNINIEKIAAAVVIDRAWDLISLAFASTICILFLAMSKVETGFIWLIIFSFAAIGVVGAILFQRFLNPIILKKYDIDVRNYCKVLPLSLLLSAFVIIIQYVRWLLLSYVMNLPVFIASSAAMVGTFIALIPVSIAGLGTREAFMGYVFSKKALPIEAGVSYSILMFGTYLIGAIWGLILFALYKREVKE